MLASNFFGLLCAGALVMLCYHIVRLALTAFRQQGSISTSFAHELWRQCEGAKVGAREKRLMLALVAFCLLVLMVGQAYALPTQVFDQVAQGYKQAATNWFAPLHAMAKNLFSLLAVIEVAWAAALWVMHSNDYQSWVVSFIKKIMGLGAFYALLVHADSWIPSIINSFVRAGQQSSGSVGLSPSDIVTRGLDMAFRVFDSISFLGLDIAQAIGLGLVCMLLAVFIALAFGVVACQLLVALVESYIAISAGVIFLGFGGSRWTQDFVQKYIGYAVATGVKLMVMYLIIGAGMTLSATWVDQLNAAVAGNNGELLQASLAILLASMMFVWLAWQVPSMAASMLAGSPTLTAGSAGSTAGIVTAGIVGAGAGVASATLSAARLAGGGSSSAQGQPGAASGLSTLSGATSPIGSASRVAPPSSVAPQADTKSAASIAAAPQANTIGAPGSGVAATTGGTGKSNAGPGFLDNLRNVRPPQVPSDSAPMATVSIRLDGGRE